MAEYTKNVDYAAKDSLTTGDPAKVIKGSELDAEFVEIQAAMVSKRNIADSQGNIIASRGDLIYGDSSGNAAQLTIGASGTLLGSDGTDASWTAAGVQADMEAETAGKFPDAAIATHLPGVVAAWCTFDGTAADPITADKAHNVTNVTKSGTGDYTVNLSITMADTDYGVLFTGGLSGSPTNSIECNVTARTTTTFTIKTFRTVSSATASDLDPVCVMVLGDQA